MCLFWHICPLRSVGCGDGSCFRVVVLGRVGWVLVHSSAVGMTMRGIPVPLAVPPRCAMCGADVLVACPDCERRIRGDHTVPGSLQDAPGGRPSFCDGCGVAFPWATREERIFELENLLDQQEIDEADRVVIRDHLQRLRGATLSEKEERAVWTEIASRAGKALTSSPIQRLMEDLISAAIRAQLGL